MVRLHEKATIDSEIIMIILHFKNHIFLPCPVFLVRTSKNTGVMFLSEVALGREKTITKDDSSLKKAPPGYDCVVARGNVEPGAELPQFFIQ